MSARLPLPASLNDSRPFTAHGASALGLTRQQLRRLLHQGEVRRVLRGVYVNSAVADTLPLRAGAVGLLVPPSVVVCRTTAAWLHGADVLPFAAHLAVPPVEVVSPAGSAVIRRAGCRAYVAELPAPDVTVVHGVRLTTAGRTAVDLARWLPRPRALAAVDAMLHLDLVTVAELLDALARLPRRRGVAQARDVVGLAEPKTESPMESLMRLRVVDAGFPRPEAQIEVYGDAGRLVCRLDLGYRDRKVALEYDGEEFHSRWEDLAYDEARREWLRRRGWVVLVFRKEHVLGRGLALELAVGEALGLARPYGWRTAAGVAWPPED